MHRILRALDAFLNPPPPPPPNLIPFRRALTCVEADCELVFDGADATRCPACGSEGIALVVMLRRLPAPVLAFRRRLAQRARSSFLRELARKRETR